MTTSSLGRDRRLLVYRVAVALLLLVALWFSITATIAGITRRHRPDIALRFQPFDALAHAQLASRRQMTPGTRPNADQRRLAVLALRRDPTLAQAARVIGIVDTVRRDMARAARAMRYSDRLTRRDVATQLWLIEYYVQREDIPEILRHFESAASSSTGSSTILFPVLVSALNHGDLIEPMAAMLRHDPWWSPSLLMAMAQGTSNVDNVADLFARLTESGHVPREDIVAVVIQRLTDAGKGEQAARLRAITHAGRSRAAPTGHVG